MLHFHLKKKKVNTQHMDNQIKCKKIVNLLALATRNL